MQIKPALIIQLDHSDLQKIYDRALDSVKNTSNPQIDSHLHPILCTIKALVDFVNQEDNYLSLKHPDRQPYNPDGHD